MWAATTVPPRSYTPSRPSCIACVEKHLGAAYVLLTELNDLPDTPAERRQGFSRRLRAIGHLFEAEDESQEWPKLHAAIRQARKHYQATEEMPDWNAQGNGFGSPRAGPRDSRLINRRRRQ